ncbi:MAG TPA: ATP synthase F0 subunit B [Firmicutes bacterium]|jgi:F-type H+-transporting ATPase subunit b|nr:ATP synthase F0 subunit B [Bacillota bacterium]
MELKLTGTFFFMVFNFLVLVIVLVFLLYRPIQGILEQRKKKISNDLSEAQKSKESWEQKQREAKMALEKASVEASQMVDNARAEAEHLREEIINKARQEAEDLRQRNYAEIERAKKDAQDELRDGAVKLAILAASKAIGSKMSTDINESLIRGVLSSIEKGA